jgi:Domain of unknown function (DUF4389)
MTMADPTPLQEPREPGHEPHETLWLRLLWMILIGMLLGLAQTVLQMAALLQFILMALRQGKPNVELAWFGKRMGDWMAKAVRYQTAADEEKPWPWTPLD